MNHDELEALIDKIEAEGYIVLGKARAKYCDKCARDLEKAQRELEASFHTEGCKFPSGGACGCD